MTEETKKALEQFRIEQPELCDADGEVFLMLSHQGPMERMIRLIDLLERDILSSPAAGLPTEWPLNEEIEKYIVDNTDGMSKVDAIFYIIDWLRSRLKEGGGWISVKDRLPERMPNVKYSQVPCLVNHKGSIKILCFNHEHLCWDDEDMDDYCCDINDITHWMPLPQPTVN